MTIQITDGNPMTNPKFRIQTLVLASIWAAVILATVNPLWAASRHGAVLATGQVIMGNGSGGAAPQACGDNEDLYFTFTEVASPAGVELERETLDASMIELTVTIDEVCEPGQATFDYEHRSVSGDGEIGLDIGIEPVAPRIALPIETGASQSVQVAYQVLERDEPGSEDKYFELVGTRIDFLAGQVAGGASRDTTVATVVVLENGPPLPPDRIPGSDEQIFDAGHAFNDACETAVPGSSFANACATIGATDLTDAQISQVARAWDAHEMAGIPTASSEGGRIQSVNVGNRITELRSGATGSSISGVALAFNGQQIDASWLPASAVEAASNSGEGGGSSLLSERFGFFINGEVSLGDRDRRGKETGYDFDSWGLTAGMDYRIDSGSFAGISLGYSEYDADLDLDGGSTSAETITIQGYGSYSFTDDFYLDATLGYSMTDVSQRRVVDLSGIGDLTRTIARGSTDARQYSASLSANYRLPLEMQWSFTPYAELQYAWNEIDGFIETGSPFALGYGDQDFESEMIGLGFRATRAFSFSRGVLSPFLDASYRYENDNDGYLMQPSVVEATGFGPDIEINSPDRHFGRLDAGLSWVFLSGQQLFLSYSTLVGESDTTRHSIYFGFRGEF